jgi:hypothetical protein
MAGADHLRAERETTQVEKAPSSKIAHTFQVLFSLATEYKLMLERSSCKVLNSRSCSQACGLG